MSVKCLSNASFDTICIIWCMIQERVDLFVVFISQHKELRYTDRLGLFKSTWALLDFKLLKLLERAKFVGVAWS